MSLNVGAKIKYIRESKNITSNQLAQHIGHKSLNAILRIESGEISPHLNRLEEIANFLEVTVMDILTTEVPEGYSSEKTTSILGKKIEVALQNLDQSIQALAEATGMSERSLKMIVSGSSKKVSTECSLKLARSLQIPLEYLLDDETPISD